MTAAWISEADFTHTHTHTQLGSGKLVGPSLYLLGQVGWSCHVAFPDTDKFFSGTRFFDGGGGTVKFFAQSFAQLQTLVISLSVPGEGFQFPVPPGWESGSWQRGAEQEAVVEEVCQLSPPGRGCPPPTQNPQERWWWGLKEQKAGARSQLQVPCVEAWVLG